MVYIFASMLIIDSTAALLAFCRRSEAAPYVTVDTEFMRENTFWPQLCLVQVASAEEAAAIDPLADGIDLAPLYGLMRNPNVLKVFHAARQDVEIFFHQSGAVPAPIFDTQVAAMVCGFGEQAGYETLVAQLAKASVDKSSRFTDWSRRPLTERQIAYALSDVTYLRTVYEKLRRRLGHSGREAWLGEEMAILTDPRTYAQHPEDAWKRIRTRTMKPRFLSYLKAVAAWREVEAQRRDVPRSRIVRDEALLEIASHPPRTAEDLARVRGFSRSMAEGRQGAEILAALEAATPLTPEELPPADRDGPLPRGMGPLVELFKVLLKMKCEEHEVAQKLVASSSDLERIAADDEAAVPAMHGWRRDIFGEDALALKHGRLALAAVGRRIRLVPLERSAAAD
ncbi:MAG TPA: ribonuclease D [Candidatus Cybelea sp.]|nr:ribonuclease D [Candidatus Cybelea sp.]